MSEKISSIHYISQGDIPGENHLTLIEKACKGGADWVQLRVKELSETEVEVLAGKVKKICDAYYARLIINDYPLIAQKVGAYGIHLGKEDMDPDEARKLTGPDMIIGATANTIEDVMALAAKNIDYIGYGPFRYTTTKKKLSPVVGLEGYKELSRFCRKENIHIPVVAIGGIRGEDLAELFNAGIHGIAISSAINKAEDPVRAMDMLRAHVENIIS